MREHPALSLTRERAPERMRAAGEGSLNAQWEAKFIIAPAD
jgi:phage gp29-like protein